MWLYIWLGVVVIALVVEFFTLDLVSVWIGLGAFVAMILAGLKIRYEIQIVAAVVISVACILGLRRVAIKWLNKSKEKTNLDLLIGKRVKIVDPITEDECGSVKLNGIMYSVKEKEDNEVQSGQYVVVEKIEGNKLIVKKEK